MQFEFLFDRDRIALSDNEWLRVGARQVPLTFARHPRARRYVLRLCSDGTARVTIPRGGSHLEARRFANRNLRWLEKQLLRQAKRACEPKVWTAGTEILFRGKKVRLEVCEAQEAVRFAGEIPEVGCTLKVAGSELRNLRPVVEEYLWQLASRELPARVAELAEQHGFEVRRVTVRNQRSRWGSCSKRGTISLNWRLVQTPLFVRDYIILHELAHLKEMNHSRRFWRGVARLCPDFARAERWLKEHSGVFR